MITGCNLIGGTCRKGTGTVIRGVAAQTGHPLEPDFFEVSSEDLDRACALADAAAHPFRQTSRAQRADFLECIAANILAIGDELVLRCAAETGLPTSRIQAERQRTLTQLRLFAEVVRDGRYLDERHDPALPDREPAPRPDLWLTQLPLGPVAVFAASNFPLAFSVAGGDTASALAAGCPVIVKAHSAHPGTSELVGRAVQAAVRDCGLPEGVFSIVYGSGIRVGQTLVGDPRIRAVGFTGSRSGGLALVRVAQARPVPIPVFAEMSSINPVFLFPAALETHAETIADGFVAALTLGAGQFCTNPGLIITVESPATDRFLARATRGIQQLEPQTMLTAAIAESYRDGLASHEQNPNIQLAAKGNTTDPFNCVAALFKTTREAFLADPSLREEVFGAAAIVVLCQSVTEFAQISQALEGQLTASVHVAPLDHDAATRLLPYLEDKAGRVIVNGFGTGVEVAHAIVHGGPFPATSDGRSTSVGSLAIQRFLRPVCYQDMPLAMLPEHLRAQL